MKKCRKCGYELEKGARKCVRCGHEFKVRHCRICGCKLETDHEFDARFCDLCAKEAYACNYSNVGLIDMMIMYVSNQKKSRYSSQRFESISDRKRRRRIERRMYIDLSISLILLVLNIVLLIVIALYFALDAIGAL